MNKKKIFPLSTSSGLLRGSVIWSHAGHPQPEMPGQITKTLGYDAADGVSLH